MNWPWNPVPLTEGSLARRAAFRLFWCYAGAAIGIVLYQVLAGNVPFSVGCVTILFPVVMALAGYAFDRARLKRMS